MTTRRHLSAVLALALLTAVAPVRAGAQDMTSISGVRQDVIFQLTDAESKLVALATATPADKFSWRPAPGVRSVGEVFMHMVGANYMFPGMIGVKRAPDVTLTRDMEKTVTDKAQIVDMLKKSFAYAKQGVTDLTDASLTTPVDMFGQKFTYRGVVVLMATHAHEHVGQSIAYARMNGVTPPWSVAGAGGQ